MPFKTIVPPVFIQDVAVFYIVDEFDEGWLYFYVWNVPANFFELKTRISVVSAVTGDWENETSLCRSIEGVIFKENGVAGVYHYLTTDYSWTRTTLGIDWTLIASYSGVVNWDES